MAVNLKTGGATVGAYEVFNKRFGNLMHIAMTKDEAKMYQQIYGGENVIGIRTREMTMEEFTSLTKNVNVK